jgi:acyl dehydratase
VNLDHVVRRVFAPTNHDYQVRDSLLYALALGFGQDPLDPDELPYVYQGLAGTPQRVVPSQAVILGWQPFWHDDPAAGIDWKHIVHGEQHLRLCAPLPASGRVQTRHRVSGVRDKGPGRGAILQVDTELVDRTSGVRLAQLSSLQFLRGDGGCGQWGDPADAAPALPPIDDASRPTATVDYATSPQAALLYRAVSRDWMPIHVDPGVARDAGFERPISHGLNNLGLACRAILKLRARGRPEAMRTLAARFVRPGLPGDTVRVELFDGDEPGRVRFRANALERDVVLLDRGVCELDG